MSAFMCSEKHLSVLAHELGELLGKPAVDTYQRLLRENIRSMRYRYPEDHGTDVGYTKDQMWSKDLTPVVKPAQLLKLVECYEYQSCEHPQWKRSTVARDLKRLRLAILDRLLEDMDVPGYSTAAWSI